MTRLHDQLEAAHVELTELRERIEQLEATFDQRVSAKVALVVTATTIGAGDYTGKSEAEIRATAVAAALGPEAIDGKTEAYIEARFDHLAERAQEDPVRRVLADRVNRRH